MNNQSNSKKRDQRLKEKKEEFSRLGLRLMNEPKPWLKEENYPNKT